MSDMLTVVTHRAEGNEANELLNVIFVVVLPDFMTIELNIARMADTAMIVVFGVDRPAEVIPICACHEGAYIDLPTRRWDKLYREF